jgi:predicted transcriptional regulator
VATNKSDAKQRRRVWDTLSSPIRVELLVMIEALGEATVADLAGTLERPADRLYHHMHRLEEAGLIRSVGTRVTPRRDQTVYACTPQAVDFEVGPEDAVPFVRMAHAMAKSALSSLESAVAHGEISQDRSRRNGLFRTEVGWLNRTQQRAVVRHMTAVQKIFAESRSGRRRGRKSVAVLLLSPSGPVEAPSRNESP